MFCMGFSHFLSTKSAHKVFGQSEVMVENIYPRCHTKEQNLKQCGWKASTFLSHATIPAPVCVNDHAGYIYCGACAAHAYRQIDPQKIKRIFILGPAHHVRLYGCALSSMEKYQTPFYDLTIDSKVYKELMATGHLEQMSRETDEQEHSIEMHLPYIAKVMESKKGQFTIVPILVGSLQGDKEKIYGKLLGEYLSNPENLFVVSSDFCHWGRRFNFIYNDEDIKYLHLTFICFSVYFLKDYHKLLHFVIKQLITSISPSIIIFT
ncbi:protein MEMO1 isoform X3 [Octopus sinensis]|uniref:Protein MEMO1 isoform X3 n=1 Tax=Octopus sinensis TaxID=2607531 RepID=A0A7E6F6D3_9MOLL|nr:protein MEMO1 isoform X3 [Octopus sinensis]